MASSIPFDLFVLFAQFGGNSLAFHLAQTCRGVKRRLDQRYEVKRMMKLSKIVNRYNHRNPAVFGKFISVCVNRCNKMAYLPASVRILFVPSFRSLKRLVIPPNIEELRITRYSYGIIRDVSSLYNIRSLKLADQIHMSIHRFKWPPNLETIQLRVSHLDTLRRIVFPKTLRKCTLMGHFMDFDDRTFPATLETLEVEFGVDDSTDMPAGLRNLKIIIPTRRPLPRLPKNLWSLEIVDAFKNPPSLPELPDSLERLEISTHSLVDVKLPLNLKYCSGSNVGMVHNELIAMGMTKITETCYEKIPQ